MLVATDSTTRTEAHPARLQENTMLILWPEKTRPAALSGLPGFAQARHCLTATATCTHVNLLDVNADSCSCSSFLLGAALATEAIGEHRPHS